MDPTNMDDFVKDIQNKLNEKADEKTQSIDKMFKSNLISPRSYKNRKQQVETWKQRKRKEIKKTEKQLMLGWKQANNLIDQIRLSSRSIIAEGGNNNNNNNNINKEDQKQELFKASKNSESAAVQEKQQQQQQQQEQKQLNQEEQVSELIELQSKSNIQQQQNDPNHQNQSMKQYDKQQQQQQQEQFPNPKKQSSQLLQSSGNTQQINSIVAIALLDDSARLAQSGQIKDDMMISANKGFFSSFMQKTQSGFGKRDDESKLNTVPVEQEQQDQQPSKPSFKAINDFKAIQDQKSKSSQLNTSRDQNKIDIFALPEGINYEKKSSVDSSEQTTFRRLNQAATPAAPPYTPLYVSEDQSKTNQCQRSDKCEVVSNAQNSSRDNNNNCQQVKVQKSSLSNSYQSEINENMLLIPDKLKGMHVRTDSDNISEGTGALISISGEDKIQQKQQQQQQQQQQSQQQQQQIIKQQLSQQMKDKQAQQKKSRNIPTVIQINNTDSINSNQSDLQSDYEKISDLVAVQLMQIYIEDTIQCCIFKIIGFDLSASQQNLLEVDQEVVGANAIFQDMRQPNVENAISALNQEILERINGEEEEEQQSKYKGIQTDVQLVKKYVLRIKDNIGENKTSLISNLSTPLFRDPLVTLAHLQNYEYKADQQGQKKDEDQADDQDEGGSGGGGGAADIIMAQQSVLNIDLYLDIERKRKDQRLLDWADKDEMNKVKDEMNKVKDQDNKSKDQEIKSKEEVDKKNDDTKQLSQDQAQFFARQWQNIHNKAIFDALNEAFDSYRPFGLRGPPLPWSKKLRTLKQVKVDKDHFNNIFTQVNDKVIEWASTRAGAIKLRIPQDLDGQDDIEQKKQKFPIFTREQQQQRLNQVRQQKLAIMLAEQVDENESLWLDYEYEETQVMLDLTDMILEQLGGETANILRSIEEKRRRDDTKLINKQQQSQ